MTYLKPTEMNTTLAKRLKAIFDRSRDHRYTAAKAAKKLKPAGLSGAGDPGGDHVDSDAPPKGVLGKDDEYAQRGSDYIRSKNGRGVYRNFSHPHLEQIRDMVRQVAEFPGGPVQNFSPKAKDENGKPVGQSVPYVWEAHHILPGSAFYYETASGPCFTYQQLRLLLQTDYNLNHGHNIIMLPKESWAVPVHTLLQHPGDHPQYTQRVMERLKEISKDIQAKIDKGEPHKDVVLDLFEQLKELEEEFWDFIVGLSEVVVAAVTSGQTYVHDHVRFAPEKGKSTYDYGALF